MRPSLRGRTVPSDLATRPPTRAQQEMQQHSSGKAYGEDGCSSEEVPEGSPHTTQQRTNAPAHAEHTPRPPTAPLLQNKSHSLQHQALPRSSVVRPSESRVRELEKRKNKADLHLSAMSAEAQEVTGEDGEKQPSSQSAPADNVASLPAVGAGADGAPAAEGGERKRRRKSGWSVQPADAATTLPAAPGAPAVAGLVQAGAGLTHIQQEALRAAQAMQSQVP